MQTVDTLLDAVKANCGIKSDYKLAQFLEVTQNTVANWRHARSRPDDKMISRLADLAEIDLEEIEVLAVQLQAERCQNEDAKRLWLRIARRLQGGGALAGFLAALAVSLLVGVPTRADASTLSYNLLDSRTSCALCQMSRKWILKLLRRRPHVQGSKVHPQPAAAAG